MNPHHDHKDNKDDEDIFFSFFFNKGDTSIMARLQTRKFGQAPILLFLTPRQALSSHPRIFVMIICESINFHPVK